MDEVITLKDLKCVCCGKLEQKVLAPILAEHLTNGGTVVYLCKVCSFPNAPRPWKFRLAMWIFRLFPWSMGEDWKPEPETPEDRAKRLNVPKHTKIT